MGEQMNLDRLAKERLGANAACAARERITALFDEGTFVETDAFVSTAAGGSGVITGFGEVEGGPVFVFSQDCTQNGGAVGRAQGRKIARLYETAVKTGAPVVGIYDSLGADISEGNEMLAAYREILEKACNLSGVVPQISLVLGVCGGVSAMMAMAADFVVMSKKAELFVTPPSVSTDSSVSGTAEAALGCGAAQLVLDSEGEAIKETRRLVSMLPQNNLSAAAMFDFAQPDDLSALAKATADIDSASMCEVVQSIADKGSFMRLCSGFGKGAHTSLVTLGGNTVGIVSTRGAIDRDGAARIARLMLVCDSFQIPVVTLINTTGIAPSGAAEIAGSIRDIARLAQVYAEASTPKIALITGEATGSAYVALGSADITLAWPGAVVSAMPVPAAVAFLKGSEITAERTRAQVEADYRNNEASVYAAAKEGFVSDIVTPEQTREALIKALDMLASKRTSGLPKKHANLSI